LANSRVRSQRKVLSPFAMAAFGNKIRELIDRRN
jgi:hypothetical protein